MRPVAGDSIAVFGVGAVGLSGLMAAKIAGCDPIIAVDIHDQRLALARELGATHAINHSGRTDVVAEIRKITGSGVRYLARDLGAARSLARGGRGADAGRHLRAARQRTAAAPRCRSTCRSCRFGRAVRGVIQGESHPLEFIPKLVDFLMHGRMPVDRMITFYPLADINRAAEDSNNGTVIKPVLRMS